MGTSQVLDAVAWAFVCTHATLYSKQTSTEALAAYGVALKGVAAALGDATQRQNLDLLCALNMILICQSWLSKPGDQCVDYCAVISHLLPGMIAQNGINPLEYVLLIGSFIIIVSLFGHCFVNLPWRNLESLRRNRS